ncbi:MAG: iron-siderophore ABC transporter substrate-binding protein [Pleurocapsa sp. SU_5_0]|nr:iron-siderophore ABC transporter substrate-binding protein [Pleurocapsa sp. SU_5_0]
MRISIQFLVLAMMVGLAIVSCQSPAQDNYKNTTSKLEDCRTIEHQMGKTEVCGQPQRIVVFGPWLLESLLALNVQPVGYAAHIEFFQEDYTDPAKQIPYLGDRITQQVANVGSAFSPSIEAILKVKPDLIIGTEYNDDVYDTLSQIAPTLMVKDAFDDPEQSLRTIAQAVDRGEQVEQLLTQTQQQITAARSAFAPLVANHPRVALLSASQLQNIEVENSSGACGSLVKELGFQLVFPPGMNNNDSDLSIPISLEILPQLNDTDLILLLGYNFSNSEELDSMDRFKDHQLSDIKQAWSENAIAQSLDASKAERVYFAQGYLCTSLPGAIGTKLYLEELKQQLLPSPAS